MYNLNIQDTAANNVMFEKPWSEVTELDIKQKAEELERLGPRFFHKKMDRFSQGFKFEFNRPIPPKLISWHEKEIAGYKQLDQELSSNPSTSRPLVSVVVPLIRSTAFLKDAISTLVAQDYQNVEVVIVNDGHSEEIEKEVESLKAQFSQKEIRLLNKKQGGISEAKNFGVKQSRGTYVMVLESEDLLKPDYISKGITALKAGNSNIFYSGVEFRGEKNGDWQPEHFDEYGLRYHNSIPKAAIFSRTLIQEAGGFKPSMPFSEDWDFWLNCTKAGLRPAQSNEKLIIDRVFSDSDSNLYSAESEKIQAAIIKISNQDLFPATEVIEAHDTLIKYHSDWHYRCEVLEKSHPQDSLLRFLIALGFEGRGQIQDAMNNLGASIQFSEYKNWQALYRLAKILEQNNKPKEAKEFYHSVRTLRPDMKSLIAPLP